MSGPGDGVADAGDLPQYLLFAALARSPILSQCSRQELARLLPFLRERHLQPGEALCRAGQPARDMWLVVRGTLRLRRGDSSSHDVSEGLVGEEAAIGIGRYFSDVVAIDEVTVVALDKDVTPGHLRGHNARAEPFGRSMIRAFAPTAFADAPVEVQEARLTPGVAAWKLLGWLTAVVAPLFVLDILARHGLRWEQQQLAAVLASAAALWIFGAVPPYVAGLLVVLVCVTLGIVPTTVILSGFASNGFFLALSVFCLSAVLIDSGAINRAFLMLMKYCPRSAFWHDAASLFTGFVLTPVIASAPDRARALAPLAAESAQTLGYEPGSRDRMRLTLSMFIGATMFSPMFLTGGALNLMLYGSLPEQVQDAIPGVRWLIGTSVAMLAMVVAFLAAYAFVFRHAATPGTSRRTIDMQLDVLGPVRSTEWLAIGGVLLYFGAVATVSEHKIDHRLIALSVVCGYLVLGTLGKDQLNFHIDWSTLLLLGTVIGLIATIVHVDLHTVTAARLVWLGEIMTHQPSLFVAILALTVVLCGLWIPRAGAFVGLLVVPLAMVNGMSAWVVVFVILLTNDVWIFPRQSEVYRTFRDLAGLGADDEELFLRFNAFMGLARFAALALSVVYWQRIRVL